MPIMKDKSTSPITSLITPIEQEQRISNNLLKSKVELKDTTLSRMVGTKSEVTYYRQKTTGSNNYIANTANIHTLDPNTIQFEKIESLIIVCQGEIATNTQTEDVGKTLSAEGSFKTLPGTIKPLPNDHFIMLTAGKKNLYRVTGVNKSTIEDDAAYEVNYMLIEEDSVTKLGEIENLVVEEYVFEYSHVGTSFRTLYRKDEYKALGQMNELYTTLGEVFNRNFFDKSLNTYILHYTTADLNARDTPYITAGVIQQDPIRVEENIKWVGSYMYDRELVEFISKNKLFEYINKRPTRPTRYIEDTEKMYPGTLYYALEKRDHNVLKYTHFIPIPVIHATPGSLPHLYGKVDLIPTLQSLEGNIFLYPPKLIQYINTIPADILKDISLNTFDDIYDLIIRTIALWINRSDVDYIQYITLIYQYLDKFYDENTRSEYIFYLYPILAYVVRKTMETISSKIYTLR